VTTENFYQQNFNAKKTKAKKHLVYEKERVSEREKRMSMSNDENMKIIFRQI
jgi:hypothetical protein